MIRFVFIISFCFSILFVSHGQVKRTIDGKEYTYDQVEDFEAYSARLSDTKDVFANFIPKESESRFNFGDVSFDLSLRAVRGKFYNWGLLILLQSYSNYDNIEIKEDAKIKIKLPTGKIINTTCDASYIGDTYDGTIICFSMDLDDKTMELIEKNSLSKIRLDAQPRVIDIIIPEEKLEGVKNEINDVMILLMKAFLQPKKDMMEEDF